MSNSDKYQERQRAREAWHERAAEVLAEVVESINTQKAFLERLNTQEYSA